MTEDPTTAPESGGDEHGDDAANRPRGWFLAAAAAGIAGGTLATITAFVPGWAPAFAGGGVFIGALIGALLMRRARDQEIIAALARDDEAAADQDWELTDIAEHYRRNSFERRRAEAASLAKSQFLATVSHELRTPLSGMLGLADVLGETRLDAEQETFTRAIRTSGELMLGLVDDMLDFAKIEAGRFELAPAETAFEPLLEEVTELFFSRAEAKGLDLAVYVDPAVPARVTVDAARLRQVMINLIGNALKFTETGGVAVIAEPAGRGGIALRVEDTGPGIPEGEAERIFDEYAQASTDRQYRVAGSGLGLAIAQRIVERMGGRIAASPRPGGGTVFAFALDLQPAGGEAATRPDLAGKRALIVGRGGLASSIAARHLTDCGAAARIATGITQAAGLAGAAMAAGEPYDFLVLDDHAVDEPGVALATIRDAAGGALPAAVVIAPGRHGSIDRLRVDGFNAYLVRPVRRRSLLRIAEGLAAGADDFGRDPRDERAVRRKPRPGARLRVLVAEDDAINALLMRAMLQRLDHEVVETADGDTALARLRGERFDAALVDLSLPGRDGIAIAEAVRSGAGEHSACRLIAVTADTRDETRDRALAAGFDDFVLKPLTPAGLAELLQRGGFETRAA